MPRGWWGAVPGGWPSTVVRGVWCQALSLPRSPVLSDGQPGFSHPCVPGAFGVPKALLPKGKGRDVYPGVQVNGLGCVCCVRAVCKYVVA